jgi:hypothetical protein
MRQSLTLNRTSGKNKGVTDEDRAYLISCLVQISIEKSKDDMYSFYTKYWEEKFKDLDMDNVVTLIKCDFNHLDPTCKDEVKKIMTEKKWKKE